MLHAPNFNEPLVLFLLQTVYRIDEDSFCRLQGSKYALSRIVAIEIVSDFQDIGFSVHVEVDAMCSSSYQSAKH